MKKLIIFLLLIVAAVPAAFADKKADREKMHKEILEFKIDYLSKEMELNEKQKAEFKKVYTEFSDLRRSSSREARRLKRELKKNKNATDADYKRLAEAEDVARQKDAEIVKTYDAKFQTFISPKQLYKMKQGEESFQKKLEQMQKSKKK